MEQIKRERKRLENIRILFSVIRLIPHLIIFHFHPQRLVIRDDIKRWMEWKNFEKGTRIQYVFFYLMTFCREFRNIFYYRIGLVNRLISWLCPGRKTLFIFTKNIGAGLIIQHGFSTIISAKSIGKNCFINQQVTIGFSGDKSPVIGDNVLITAGSKIIGGVMIGNNVKIGANAVVIKDVPRDCTVVGVPAYIVKKNGEKVHKNL